MLPHRPRSEIVLWEFAGKAGRVKRRTETTTEQKRIFSALKVKEPALVYAIQADTLA